MAGILGAPTGTKPTDLSGPVPGASEQQDAMALFNSGAGIELPAPVAGAPQAADPMAAFNQGAGLEPAPVMADPNAMPIDEVPTVPDESVPERFSRVGNPVQATKELVMDQVARFRSAWAVGDRERKTTLDKMYGSKNVRKASDGTFQIRRNGEKGFRDFDPDTGIFSLDIIGDLLDGSRDAFEGTIELGGRIGGGIMGAAEAAPAGALAGLPAGPAGAAAGGIATGALGAIAGQAVGGAIAAPLALQAGDWIAENVMRIERDPERSRMKEAATAGAIAAGIGVVFGGASAALARRRAAQDIKKSSLTTSEVRKTAEEIEQSADNLAKNGINLRQGKMVLTPGQIAGDLAPEARVLDKELSDVGGVRDFFVEQGKLVQEGWDKLSQSIVNVTGRPPEEIFSRVKGAAKEGRDIEGKILGDYRNMALKASKGKPQEMPRTMQGMPEFFSGFGFKLGKNGMEAPSMQAMQEMFPDASSSVLGRVKTLATKLEKKLANNVGGLSLKETDELYSEFQSTINNFKGTKTGDRVANKLIRMKDAIRDDWTMHIGRELQETRPDALNAYKASMQKYSDIMVAQKTLKNVLKKNDLSAAAFANQIYSPAQGKDRVAQLKTLIDDTDPNLSSELAGLKLQFIQQAAMNKKTGRVDWRKVSSEIDALEKSEVLSQMMSPEQRTNFRNFLKIADKVDSEFKFKEGEAVSKSYVSNVRNLIITMLAPVSFLAKVTSGQNMAQSTIDSIGKDRALVRWLNGEGLELVLQGMPAQQRAQARSQLTNILARGSQVGVGSVLQGKGREAVQPETPAQ